MSFTLDFREYAFKEWQSLFILLVISIVSVPVARSIPVAVTIAIAIAVPVAITRAVAIVIAIARGPSTKVV